MANAQPSTLNSQILSSNKLSPTSQNISKPNHSDITQSLDHGSSIYFNRLLGNKYNDLLQAWCMLENVWQLEVVGSGHRNQLQQIWNLYLPPPPNFYPVMGLYFFPIQSLSARKHPGDHKKCHQRQFLLCLHLEFPFCSDSVYVASGLLSGAKWSSLQSCLNTSGSIRSPNMHWF